jgi:hypothetical protein
LRAGSGIHPEWLFQLAFQKAVLDPIIVSLLPSDSLVSVARLFDGFPGQVLLFPVPTNAPVYRPTRAKWLSQ